MTTLRIIILINLIFLLPHTAFTAEEESCNTLMMRFLSETTSTPNFEMNFPKSDLYLYQRESNDHVTIIWQESAEDAITRQCGKEAAQEKLENEISRLGKIEKLSGKDSGSWLYREIIIEVINKKLVPDFGIVGISFSNPLSSDDLIAIEVSLKSVCGYTASYNIDKQSLSIKGAYIK